MKIGEILLNNTKQDLNLRIGKVLAEARLNSGLSQRDVEKNLKNISAKLLSEIEMGHTSIPCCDLHELLELYPLGEDQLMFFCTISLEKEGTKHE